MIMDWEQKQIFDLNAFNEIFFICNGFVGLIFVCEIKVSNISYVPSLHINHTVWKCTKTDTNFKSLQ